jgi:hypothetical protein
MKHATFININIRICTQHTTQLVLSICVVCRTNGQRDMYSKLINKPRIQTRNIYIYNLLTFIFGFKLDFRHFKLHWPCISCPHADIIMPNLVLKYACSQVYCETQIFEVDENCLSPTLWGTMKRLKPHHPPPMPHVSPGWGSGGFR